MKCYQLFLIVCACTHFEMLTRQMCIDLIEYITIDKYQGKKVPRDIHIYYKLIDKSLTDRKNALAK